jgi:hypothetical protein
MEVVSWAILLIPMQLLHGKLTVNARGSGLPLVALRALAMQASISDSKKRRLRMESF